MLLAIPVVLRGPTDDAPRSAGAERNHHSPPADPQKRPSCRNPGSGRSPARCACSREIAQIGARGGVDELMCGIRRPRRTGDDVAAAHREALLTDSQLPFARRARRTSPRSPCDCGMERRACRPELPSGCNQAFARRFAGRCHPDARRTSLPGPHGMYSMSAILRIGRVTGVSLRFGARRLLSRR